jgi:hypothetical protein
MRAYGGNPSVPASLLAGVPARAGVNWVASGRDGYVLIQRVARVRHWLLPEFLCGVVPRTLAGVGTRVSAYRPGALEDVPLNERRRSAIVLLWDVDRGPLPRDVHAARPGKLVVQDRCVWAGLPWHLRALPARHLAIGSCRKWIGIGDGGWVVGGQRAFSGRWGPGDEIHVAAAAAAALIRRLRSYFDDSGILESANLACVDLAEAALGTPRWPRAQSRLGHALLMSAGRQDEARRSRARLAGRIAGLLGQSNRPRLGAIGIRVITPHRDALRSALSRKGVYAPVHWPDGAWTGSPRARAHAAATLTLPAPSEVSGPEEEAYLRMLAGVIGRFDVRVGELTDLQ